MLHSWMNCLPLFVVRWIAQRKGEVFRLGGTDYHIGTCGVLFAKQSDTTKEKA